MISNQREINLRFILIIFILTIFPSFSHSGEVKAFKIDSLTSEIADSVIVPEPAIEFKTYRIEADLNSEPDYIKDQLYNFQYEMGIPKGLELQFLEIYIDKTNKDMGKWNVLINDTTLQFSPFLPWVKLSEESKQLLDNWSDRTLIKPDNVDSIRISKNEMFRVMTVPLITMNEESKLSQIQKDYSYEIIIVDDYPEQIEIEPNRSLIIKRLDDNRFRIKLSRFNRSNFERWADNRDDDPYIYTTSIVVYDKISNQRTRPINLKFTFGEY
ncbi:MAG: hypothetical protein KDD00_03670 [Ignavibacteriae bacterium]|nr:hypothetical protein [Ignavibacteriota bacterium]